MVVKTVWSYTIEGFDKELNELISKGWKPLFETFSANHSLTVNAEETFFCILLEKKEGEGQ